MTQIESVSGVPGHGVTAASAWGSVQGLQLSPEDLSIVRRSLPSVQARIARLGARLLENLLALMPDLRQKPEASLASSLMHTLARLDDQRAFDRGVEAIRRAGMQAQHVQALGFAFIVALGETLGPDFTQRHLAAWRAAYDYLSQKLMKQA